MDLVRARVGWSWLVALAMTCALAVPSRPASPRPSSLSAAGLAVPSPWPSIRGALVAVWVFVERGVDEVVAFADRPVDRRSMRERLAELRAQKRVLERRLVELRRQMAVTERHRCGQCYRPNPHATSALDVMRGQ